MVEVADLGSRRYVVAIQIKICPGPATVKDIVKAQAYPMACKDAQGQLRVGASVGTSADTDTVSEPVTGKSNWIYCSFSSDNPRHA